VSAACRSTRAPPPSSGLLNAETRPGDRHPLNVRYEQQHQPAAQRHEGTGTLGAPGAERFWATSVAGTELQTLDWTVEPGDWTAVIMNADASSGVTAELVSGARASNIDTIAWTKITIGLIALVGGGLAMFLGIRRSARGSVSGVIDLRDEESAQQTATLRETTAPGVEPSQPRPGAWSRATQQTLRCSPLRTTGIPQHPNRANVAGHGTRSL